MINIYRKVVLGFVSPIAWQYCQFSKPFPSPESMAFKLAEAVFLIGCMLDNLKTLIRVN